MAKLDFKKDKRRGCLVGSLFNIGELAFLGGCFLLLREWGRGDSTWKQFSGPFALVGLGIILIAAAGRLKKPSRTTQESSIGKASDRADPLSLPPETVLRPGRQRLSGLYFEVLVNLLWNGSLSVIILYWLPGLIGWLAGRIPVTTAQGFMFFGISLFLTPFVVIGVGLMRRLLGELAKLRAPRVELRLAQGLDWHCGQDISIRWMLPRRADVDQLTIDFICCEKATDSSGSTPVPDIEIVARIPLFDHFGRGLDGAFTFAVPPGLMPSFESDNHAIEWAIRVRTRGPGPDAEDHYPINLLPDRRGGSDE